VTTVAVGDRVSIQPLIMPRVGDYYAERGLFHLSDQIAVTGLSWQWGGMAEKRSFMNTMSPKCPSPDDQEAALVEPTAVAVYAAIAAASARAPACW
jgi:(R,R)-butanediol dehydrogenase/meso-butanediol dehydrogenase/diacetyl reductase